MPTLSEIARRAQVSKSTVSLVLNNGPHVSEPMRRRVQAAIEELQRAEAGTNPSMSRNGISFLLIHPAKLRSSQVFRELLQGVQAGVDEAGARLTLAVHQAPLLPSHATHMLLHDPALRPDGVILMGARLQDPLVDEVRGEGLPCVLLARQCGPAEASTVGVDNVRGAGEATRHLVGLGHRRIAFLGGDPSFDYTGLRIDGYRQALAEASLTDDGQIFLGQGDEAARAFLAKGALATAIVFVNDEYALYALPVLSEAGLKVPRDLSVVCFDDTEEVASHIPALTAVAVPRQQIGYWSARVLADQARCPDLLVTHVVLRPQLRVRASSAPPGRAAKR